MKYTFNFFLIGLSLVNIVVFRHFPLLLGQVGLKKNNGINIEKRYYIKLNYYVLFHSN